MVRQAMLATLRRFESKSPRADRSAIPYGITETKEIQGEDIFPGEHPPDISKVAAEPYLLPLFLMLVMR